MRTAILLAALLISTAIRKSEFSDGESAFILFALIVFFVMDVVELIR